MAMKIIFISDIHANLSALESVVRYLGRLDFDEIYCLGDIIGYGNFPNEVITLLQQIGARSILGNHEYLFLKEEEGEKYNFPYTRKIITDSSLEYIRSLPRKIEIPRFDTILSHGVPNTDFEYLYANSDFTILKNVCFKRIIMGHTHYPMMMSYYDKTIINPGSVGLSRDRTNKASFLLADFVGESYHFIRCNPY